MYMQDRIKESNRVVICTVTGQENIDRVKDME